MDFDTFFRPTKDKLLILLVLVLFVPSPGHISIFVFGFFPAIITFLSLSNEIGMLGLVPLMNIVRVFIFSLLLLGAHYLLTCVMHKLFDRKTIWLILGFLMLASLLDIYLVVDWYTQNWVNIFGVLELPVFLGGW